MNNIIICDIHPGDINDIVNIYNSNKTFLYNHIGILSIDKGFIFNEIEEMKQVGFKSQIIKNSKNHVLGICDYKIDNGAYLSLLMTDNKLRGIGLGKIIYNKLEILFKSKNINNIRIDVVYDYKENALKFWEKQGFIPSEKVNLEWNGYKSNAIKMHKLI